MEKDKNRNRRSHIFLIVSMLCFIILIIIIIYEFYTLNKLSIKNKELKNTLTNLKENYNIEINKESELKNNIDELNNIDNNISKTKEEVFKLASKLENKITNNETKYKIAYLTFDDGPYYSTDKVLDILKKYNIKATFFTIGLDKDICFDNKNYSCSDTYKKIVDNGHTIANHTYSHLIFRGLYNNSDSFMNQVIKQEELIKDRTGVTTNILRFPGGSNTAKSLCRNDIDKIMKSLQDRHYGWVDWTAQDGDGGYLPSYEKAWSNFTNSINENIEVILFHDYSNITISMLPKAIEYLEERDYILLPLFYESIKVNK